MLTRAIRLGAIALTSALLACSTSAKSPDGSPGVHDGSGASDVGANRGIGDAPLSSGGAAGPGTGGRAGSGGGGGGNSETASPSDAGDAMAMLDGGTSVDGEVADGGGWRALDAIEVGKAIDLLSTVDGMDANVSHDLGADRPAPVEAPPCSHAFSDPNCWSSQDLSVLHPNGALFGGIYDGKHVYFSSSIVGSSDGWWNGNKTGVGQMLSYDPQQDFASDNAWTAFATTGASPAAFAFAGAVFDGRYIYFPPFNPSGESVALRYDTTASFTQATAWASADLQTFNKSYSPVGYVGGAFDGRYVYFVPNCFYEYPNGLVLRYDSQGSFADAASWSVFDTQTLSQDAAGFVGVAFDGRYLYFPSFGDLSNNWRDYTAILIVRYDTQAPFTAATSWTIHDATKMSNTAGFGGAVFDGRYVYFLPGDYQPGDTILRFDSKGDFATAGSWTGFGVTSVTGRYTRFMGGLFDGRYLYLVPTRTGDVAVRYDTTADFGTATSWAAFDLKGWDARAEGFAGGAFDGRFVYFVPGFGKEIVRFEAYATPVKQTKLPASFL